MTTPTPASPLPDTFSARQVCEHLATTCGLRPESLPRSLLHRASRKKHVPLELVSYAWTSSDIRRLRLTEIYGALGTHIVNIGIFPHPTSVLPLMQLEILVVKQRLSLFIVDAVLPPGWRWSLEAASPSQYLRQLASTYGAFPPTEKRSEWAQTVISQDAIWSRPNNADAIAPACEATLSYLRWCGTVMAAGRGRRTSREQARQYEQFLDYVKTTCIDHEPSRPYLGSMFGPEWSEWYMREFLFIDEKSAKSAHRP